MNPNTDALSLRPLGVGEIFDRAITLYVRNFIPISAVLLAVLIPVSVIQYFGYDKLVALQGLLKSGQLDSSNSPQFFSQFFSYFSFAGFAALLSAIFTPFANVAIACCVTRVYRNEPVDWLAAYRVAFRRWAGILGLELLALLIFLAFWFGSVIVFTIVTFVVVLAFNLSPVVGVVFAVVEGLLGLAWLVLVIVLAIALLFGFFAVGTENMRTIESLSRGFSRIFARIELRKAVLVGLSLIAIEIGIVILSELISLLVGRIPYAALAVTLLSLIVSTFSTAFIAVLMSVYYFDVRIRQEGFDMQASLDTLAGVPQPTA